MIEGYEARCNNCGRQMPEDEYQENNGICVVCKSEEEEHVRL